MAGQFINEDFILTVVASWDLNPCTPECLALTCHA